MKIRILGLLLAIFLVTQGALGEAQPPSEGQAPATIQDAAETLDLPLLVNNYAALPEDYKPTKLIKLYDHKRNFKLNTSSIRMEKHVFEAMNEMFKAAKADKVSGFIITSGYRSEKDQKKIYKNDKKGVAAKPGHSEHQTGLAFDVTGGGNADFSKTKHFKWLKAHCWEYGFILRYPKGKEDITEIPYEPWHYRYVGVEHALAIRDMGEDITLEEYIQALMPPQEEAPQEPLPEESPEVVSDAPPEDAWAQQS